MKMIPSSSRKTNWFEVTENMNRSESTAKNWIEISMASITDWFEIIKNWFEISMASITDWFEIIKNWFEELNSKGIFRYILIGVGALLLLIVTIKCGCFCVNIIITAIRLMVGFIFQCCRALVMAIFQVFRFIVRCCLDLVGAIGRALQFIPRCFCPPVGELMKAPGQPGLFIVRSVFEANPSGYFRGLRGK